MASTFHICRSSLLAAAADNVWQHAITMRGVNRELWPLARMSYPAEAATLSLTADQLGRPLFRSTIFLCGVLPVDYDRITIVEFERPRRFLERSTMLSQSTWQHERVVEPHGAGCRITDRVEATPRVGLLAPLHRAAFTAAFALRHRNLRKMFGELDE